MEAANPKPRLGINFKLPVIYAGNKNATEEIQDRLDRITDLKIVSNIRPTLELENLQPSRDCIHDLFMEYLWLSWDIKKKKMNWADAPIMPTPGAVGEIIQKIAKQDNISVVGIDIGGATRLMFSVFDGQFNRTVSANLGMSYSVCNVLAEAGIPNVSRWVPYEMDEHNLTNRISNKMIRPTTIPQSLEALKIEQAIAREALGFHLTSTKNLLLI